MTASSTLNDPCGPAPTAAREPFPRHAVLGGVLLLAAAMGIGRFAFTPILPAMEHAGELSTGQAGVLASANCAGYLLGALAIAIGGARWRSRAALWLSAVAVPVTTGLMGATSGMLAWGAVRFAAGAASAGVFVLASGLVLDEVRRRGWGHRGGWLFAGPGLGIVVSGAVVRAAGGALGWRGDWAALALIAATIVYPCWRWLPRPQTVPALPRAERPAAAPTPPTALGLLFVGYTLEGVGYIVTGTFLATIVDRAPGGHGLGSVVWLVVGLAALPAGAVWGALGGRFGFARALTAAFALQAAGIVLPLIHGLPFALAAAVLFGGTFIGISALTLTLAGHLTPARSASVIGRLTAAYGVGQVIGPVVAGFVSDRTDGFGPALIGAATIVLLGGIAMAALIRHDPSDPRLSR